MQVIVAPEAHHKWISDKAGFCPTEDFRAVEAVDEKGQIHGMVGFDNWTENSVVVCIALDKPVALRRLIHPVFDFIFNRANRGIILCMVRGENQRSYQVCRKLGFREAYRVKDGIKVGEDMIILEMRREECRWIEQRKAA